MKNNDFVPYSIALALKKAGFDEPCHYGYSVKMRLEPELSFGDPKMVHSKAPKNYNDNRKGIAKGLEFCSAVPLWQAQKWLREVHSIHIQIAPARDGRTEKISWHMVGGYRILELMGTSDFVVAVPYSEIDHCSYESALSAGIAAALELIEKKGE